MTVGELRKALEGVPDELELIEKYDGGYFLTAPMGVINLEENTDSREWGAYFESEKGKPYFVVNCS